MRSKLKFGKAFPDEFQKVASKTKHFNSSFRGGEEWQENLIMPVGTEDTPLASSWRKLFFPILITVIFALLFTRLFHLQIVEGKNNKELADSNRIQVKVIHAPRGVIYDRNGKILAQNEPGFRLQVASGSGNVVTHLSRDEALKMEVDGDERFPSLEIDSNRSYPYAEKTAHVLGYVAEITENELKEPEYKNYNLGDRIGRGGIEETFEKVLRGVDGGEIIEVDAQGKKVRTMREVKAIPGQNVYLTLDVSLQEAAYKALEEQIKKSNSCCGALVAQDPRSGQILSLVSYPSFNPLNLAESLAQPNSPLLNRAIAGTYPPGSTFKIISSLAGLESGKITENTHFEDTGFINLGPYRFANWFFTQHGGKDGSVDIYKALQRSNDIYFYYLGQTIGEKTLGEYAKQMGFGKPVGIDIPGEAKGLIPDDAWKRDNFGEGWYPGDTLHMAIGQGFVLATPLQISHMISTTAANGSQYPPHLALKITDPNNKTLKEFKYESSDSKFKKEYIQMVQRGLELVPKAGGTAWPFFVFPIPTAGKTGTAEFGDPKDKTHAWYTAYAPVDNPTIAATAVIEAGGEGSSASGPIVKELFRWYFSEDKKNLLKDISPIVATDSAKVLGE